jgi:hypothetical protein
LLPGSDKMTATATRGTAYFPGRVVELIRARLDLRGFHAAGDIGRGGFVVTLPPVNPKTTLW